ncbi:B3 domain-containing transcription factor VRN1-like [Humulus lupulus]|uniref:B3 domain-containing transcription factor VRN1-like n=1 Tax=Humulus lupulus TaxID=3486 RepID=UPI002B415176|nr:B3 domain-containing transcription factor VRN1-like [Humulus lupulus]
MSQGISEFLVRICSMGSEIEYPCHLDKHDKEKNDSNHDDDIQFLGVNLHRYVKGQAEKTSIGRKDDQVPRKRGRPRKEKKGTSSARAVAGPRSRASAERKKQRESLDKSQSHEEDDVQPKKRTVKHSKETEKAIDAASAMITYELIKNPAFLVVLTQYDMTSSCVDVPLKFAEDNLNGNLDSKDLTLQAHNEERKWPAKLGYYRNRVKIGQGLGQFLASKDLKEGDVCVFEMIRDGEVNEILFKVWIYKAVADEVDLFVH